MSEKLLEFKKVLEEIFEMDKSDLDFGIYRIINQKREQVNEFLDKDLLPQVKEELKTFQAKEISKEENEIFSHLATFFRRYYEGGDFISKRRYKEGVYAIPYEGEEVKLYWANHDQYYIKTSENLTNFAFKLSSGKRIHFRIVDGEMNKDNNKTEQGKDRLFVLDKKNPLNIEEEDIYINFIYQLAEKKEKQTDLNKEAAKKILKLKEIKEYEEELSKYFPTEKNKTRTLLEKQLNEFTSRYSFDYFIHKDLGGFLRRELDFYIKNEVMFLDDLDTENEIPAENYLVKIKIIKRIGYKIISFLEQLENFQKKLWLKKKFVVETNYCITLNQILEEYHSEILSNKAQIEEWKKLGFIEDNKKPKALPNLVVDTKFLSKELKEKILQTIENLDEKTNGTLIHSENFQALSLLQERYKEQINCIHIDPPYNTATSGFLYKNNYQHSSWLTMKLNVSKKAANLLNEYSIAVTHIDENEVERLNLLYDSIGLSNSGTLIWDKGMPNSGSKGIANQHEYVLFRDKGNHQIRVEKKNIDVINKKIQELIKINKDINKEVISSFRKWLKSQPNFSKSEYTYDQFDETGKAFRSDNMSATDKRQNKKFHIPIKHPITAEDCPVPSNGWRYTPESIESLLKENLILFGSDHLTMPRKKTYLESTSDSQMPSIYKSGFRGKNTLDALNLEFPFAHSIEFYNYILDACSNKEYAILDYFAGSGTTGHAVINLNREDGGNRKYILVEMGEYFDTVLKPRIQKVIFAPKWKNGKPVIEDDSEKLIKDSNQSKEEGHIFKYMRLESYEDTLNNLDLKDTGLFGSSSREEREEYMLKYLLDLETKDSSSLLKINGFYNPFNYKMKIIKNNEIREEVIDLVETFNYLIGLKVEKIYPKETLTAISEKDNKTSIEFTYQIITGRTLQNEKVFIVWRTIPGEPIPCDTTLKEYLSKNFKLKDFDKIFINGDTTINGALLTEEYFKKEMFNVQDV